MYLLFITYISINAKNGYFPAFPRSSINSGMDIVSSKACIAAD